VFLAIFGFLSLDFTLMPTSSLGLDSGFFLSSLRSFFEAFLIYFSSSSAGDFFSASFSPSAFASPSTSAGFASTLIFLSESGFIFSSFMVFFSTFLFLILRPILSMGLSEPGFSFLSLRVFLSVFPSP